MVTPITATTNDRPMPVAVQPPTLLEYSQSHQTARVMPHPPHITCTLLEQATPPPPHGFLTETPQ
eukprot:1268695-Prorocentrum_lima.AAC.1